MSRIVALVLLCLQLAFAGLPGKGFVLCLGGDHGHEHGAPVHDAGSSDDCDGLHLSRGESDQRPTEASPAADLLAHAAAVAEWPADESPANGAGATLEAAPMARGAPPGVPRLTPRTQAAEAVRTTELRI